MPQGTASSAVLRPEGIASHHCRSRLAARVQPKEGDGTAGGGDPAEERRVLRALYWGEPAVPLEVLLSAFGFEGEKALVRRAGPLRLQRGCDAPGCSGPLKLWHRRQLIALAHSYERGEPIYCFDCWKERKDREEEPGSDGLQEERLGEAKAPDTRTTETAA